MKKLIRKLMRYFLRHADINIVTTKYAKSTSVADFLAETPELTDRESSLDIGCGMHPKNPFSCENVYGVDIQQRAAENGVIIADLFREALPFDSDMFSAVTAHDFIEHIPRYNQGVAGETRFPFVFCMSEVHRVLKKGGYFFSRTPAYPAIQAFQDPTHINIITEETFPKYFCLHFHGNRACRPWAEMYGFNGQFELVQQKWCNHSLLTLLRKAQ